jgi:hypothetical protein
MTRLPYDATLRSLLRPDLAEPGGRWSILSEADASSLPQPLFLAECARLAYCRFESEPELLERLRATLAHAGFARLRTFSVAATDTQAFAAYDPQRRQAVVAFRGTQADRLRDVAIDLQLSAEPWPGGGTVHRGFGSAARSVLPLVQGWLDAEASDRLRLDLTGHSLGAALAVLVASQCRPDQVSAFGCPRVGDAQFAASVRALTIDRFVNCCDLICRLPPECRWYTHVGRQRYIGRNGDLIDPIAPAAVTADQIAARTDFLFRYLWRYGSTGSREMADHSMLNYLRAFV